jgi:endonuclease G
VTITDAENRTGTTSISLNIEQTSASVDHVVISQIYGGGGNSGATYTNDYVELYNPSTTSFNLTGWSLQYASSTGSGWGTGTQPLGGIIAPGEYYLVSLASGGAVGQPLPAANIIGEVNLSGTAGKIALVRNGEALSGNCPLNDSDIVDFVGYGSGADCSEGATKAPTANSTQAIFRNSDGKTDTNVNGSDFAVQFASPRRTAVIAEIGPSVASSDPRLSGTNAPRDASITVNFTEPVNVDPLWFNISCANGVQHNDATVANSSNFKTYVITPNTNFVPGETCSVRIIGNAIHDQDTDDSAPNTDTLSGDYSFSFTVATGAAPPYPRSVHLTMGNPSGAFANVGEPNNFLMEKDAFALSYNRDRGTPNWVSWHLDKSWTGDLTRNDTFRPDPAVPSDWYRVRATDYFGSGFDRGHMTPNADRDNANSIPLNQETFLMTNMIPQAPDNNQGPWAAMENDLRALFTDASGNEQELYIIAGGAGTGGTGSNGSITTAFADGRVTVPKYTWKVALVLPKGEDDVSRVSVATRTIAVIMPNTQGIRNNDWKNYLTTVDAVENLTGYDFFSNVSDDVENSIEAGTNGANSPVAKSQSVSGSEDAPKAITLSAMSANNNALTYTIVSQPTNGVLSGLGANIIYTPNADFYGVDSFTFRASDGQFASNVSTVTINVKEVNDAPAAAADNKTTDEDTALNFAANELVQNDSAGAANEGGQTLTVTSVIATDNTHGQVSLNGGNITYSPSENFSGQAVFDYNVCDNGTTNGAADSKCSVGTVTVTVASVNDAPVLASIANQTVNEENTITLNVSATDTEDAANTLIYSLVNAPAGAAINSSTGAFTWTPTEAQGGNPNSAYTITVKVTDNGSPALSDEKQFVVTVNEVNRAPQLAAIDNATLSWGNTLSFTATASDVDEPANNLTYSLIGAPSGASIDSSTGAFSWTPGNGQIGEYTFQVLVADNGTPVLSDKRSVSVKVVRRATTLVYTGDAAEQYSDRQLLTARLVDNGGGILAGTNLSDKTVAFTVGSQSANGSTGSNGIAETILNLTQDPAINYNVVSSFGGHAFYEPSGDTDSFDITQEDAAATYSGPSYFSTQSPTSAAARITLSATLVDAADNFAGDIRNAKVEFHRDSPDGALLGGANLSVGLVNPSDATVGTATTTFDYTLSNAEMISKGTSFKVYVVVKGYYTAPTSFDLITVSVPGADSVSGGGFLLLQASSGQYAGANGSKMNFGYTMKYNNSGKNLQGQAGIIIRSNGKTYQIKSNAVDSLAVRTDGTTKTATFTTKANMTDITNPLAPVSLGGNMRLQVDMTDMGSGGQADKVGITLWNGDGGLYFTSNWNGTTTVQQLLGGGNISVQTP